MARLPREADSFIHAIPSSTIWTRPLDSSRRHRISADAQKVLCARCGDRLRCGANADLGIALTLRNAIAEARGAFVTIPNEDDFGDREFHSNRASAFRSGPGVGLASREQWTIDGADVIVIAAPVTKRSGRTLLANGIVPQKEEYPLDHGVTLQEKCARSRYVDQSVVAGAHDLWSSHMLAASGGSFYDLPERLTYGRRRDEMEKAAWLVSRQNALAYREERRSAQFSAQSTKGDARTTQPFSTRTLRYRLPD